MTSIVKKLSLVVAGMLCSKAAEGKFDASHSFRLQQYNAYYARDLFWDDATQQWYYWSTVDQTYYPVN